jgi:hypothetical protein
MILRELTQLESLELNGLENRITAIINTRYEDFYGWNELRLSSITERGLVMITKLARRDNDKELMDAVGKFLIKRLEFKHKDN